MGILNLSPDSFSGDGLGQHLDQILERAQHMLDQGAHILDVGAESSRPGATPVGQTEEWQRLGPALRELRHAFPQAVLSVDSWRAETIRLALQNGADWINDISGGASPEALPYVAAHQATLVLMDNRAQWGKIDAAGSYQAPSADGDGGGAGGRSITHDVKQALLQKAHRAESLGVASDKIVLDPGLGFGKTPAENARLLRELETLTALPYLILIGASRKSFLARLTAGKPIQTDACAEPPPALDNAPADVLGEKRSLPGPSERLGGSLACALAAKTHGAAYVRVHDVAETTQAFRLWDAIIGEPDRESLP